MHLRPTARFTWALVILAGVVLGTAAADKKDKPPRERRGSVQARHDKAYHEAKQAEYEAALRERRAKTRLKHIQSIRAWLNARDTPWLSAGTLAEAYRRNPARADTNWLGTTLTIVGEVQRISLLAEEQIYQVTLDEGIMCSFNRTQAQEVAPLKKGSWVVVEGLFKGPSVPNTQTFNLEKATVVKSF